MLTILKTPAAQRMAGSRNPRLARRDVCYGRWCEDRAGNV